MRVQPSMRMRQHQGSALAAAARSARAVGRLSRGLALPPPSHTTLAGTSFVIVPAAAPALPRPTPPLSRWCQCSAKSPIMQAGRPCTTKTQKLRLAECVGSRAEQGIAWMKHGEGRRGGSHCGQPGEAITTTTAHGRHRTQRDAKRSLSRLAVDTLFWVSRPRIAASDERAATSVLHAARAEVTVGWMPSTGHAPARSSGWSALRVVDLRELQAFCSAQIELHRPSGDAEALKGLVHESQIIVQFGCE